jgi:hypothetical protein
MTLSSTHTISSTSRAHSTSSTAHSIAPLIDSSKQQATGPSPLRATMDSPQYKPDAATPGMANGNGKDSASPVRGFQPRHGENGVIKVQPPRREDLQPSYAQMLQGETEPDAHGWYGSMSMFAPTPLTAHLLMRSQSTTWVLASVSLAPFPAVLSAPTPISLSRRVMSVSSPSSESEFDPAQDVSHVADHFLDSLALLIPVSSRSILSPNASSKSTSRFRSSRFLVRSA